VEQRLQHSKEIVRLVDIGVLGEDPDYSSEWAFIFSSFAVPKKNGSSTIRVVTDFRKLNLLLTHRVSPISYSKYWGHDPLNFNMGDYHIKLDTDTQRLCTIVSPWGKYKYKRLPMGIKITWFLMFFIRHV
jgi:hypothetical protein